MLMGGCFCGAVRYEAGSPYHLTNCHCTTCTLDEPERLPPEDHTWTRSRLPWIRLADGLPEHREARRP